MNKASIGLNLSDILIFLARGSHIVLIMSSIL